MAENSNIEWCHHTFNPWEGCTKVGPGCDHCYAEARNNRFTGGANWGPGAPRRRTSAANWKKPLKWDREAEKLGIRYRVFCASLADVFDNEVPNPWRHDLFSLIGNTPNLDWLLLTKRIGNVPHMLFKIARERLPDNVWLGATIVNQEEADRDIGKLLSIPASVHFLSMEPLRGPVDLRWLMTENGRLNAAFYLDQVIVGGESGPGARPMHPVWVRSLRDQCVHAGVPYLFKQWGEYAPSEKHPLIGEQLPWVPDSHQGMCKVGKKKAGRILDGRTWDQYPKASVP